MAGGNFSLEKIGPGPGSAMYVCFYSGLQLVSSIILSMRTSPSSFCSQHSRYFLPNAINFKKYIFSSHGKTAQGLLFKGEQKIAQNSVGLNNKLLLNFINF